MSLLYDHNVSPHLVIRLQDIFPNAAHVALVGLDRATDLEVWQYAEQHGYTIVTKDADFSDLIVLRGFPPKVLWLRIGNCTTNDLEALLRKHEGAIQDFLTDPQAGTLILS